jgi:hypothetical protein
MGKFSSALGMRVMSLLSAVAVVGFVVGLWLVLGFLWVLGQQRCHLLIVVGTG